MAVTYGDATYYYETNLQGDVIAILDSTGAAVVQYSYDAWGRLLSDEPAANSIGNLNPLRYRGYVYDDETGLYYLQSRYYDPALGRFLNADDPGNLGVKGLLSYNLFAYCGNNPANRVDTSGQFWKELWDAFTQTIQQASSYFAVAAGVTQVDSPVPGPADVVGAAMAIGGLFVCATIAVNSIIFAKPASDVFSKADERSQAIAITRESDNPVIFPSNPNDFNPIGLIKIPRAGTKNGAFISWMDPLTNAEVFRWDENPNYSNGPHYHICGTGHYYPGNIVPEPYATIYFPFR